MSAVLIHVLHLIAWCFLIWLSKHFVDFMREFLPDVGAFRLSLTLFVILHLGGVGAFEVVDVFDGLIDIQFILILNIVQLLKPCIQTLRLGQLVEVGIRELVTNIPVFLWLRGGLLLIVELLPVDTSSVLHAQHQVIVLFLLVFLFALLYLALLHLLLLGQIQVRILLTVNKSVLLTREIRHRSEGLLDEGRVALQLWLRWHRRTSRSLFDILGRWHKAIGPARNLPAINGLLLLALELLFQTCCLFWITRELPFRHRKPNDSVLKNDGSIILFLEASNIWEDIEVLALVLFEIHV